MEIRANQLFPRNCDNEVVILYNNEINVINECDIDNQAPVIFKGFSLKEL